MRTTAYAGIAGQVIRDFVTLRSLLATLPYLLLVLLLGTASLVVTTYFVPLGPTSQALTTLIFISPVMGHDALRARYGVRPGGVEVVLFALRFALLLAVWWTPLILCWHAFGAHLVWPQAPFVEGLLTAAVWPSLAGLCLAAAYILVAVHLTLILSTAADTLPEVFFPRRWLWMLREHSRDLPASLGALGGGVMVFYLTLLPVALLLAAGLVHLSSYLGVICALVGFLSPLGAGCILAARLAGAFSTLRDEVVPEEQPTAREDSIPLSTTALAEGPISVPQLVHNEIPSAAKKDLPGVDAMDFIQTIKSLQQRADHDLEAAIAQAKDLYAAHPGAAGVLLELAKLYRRAGREDQALQTCGRAITQALNGGMSPVAVDAFVSFTAHRERFDLAADIWLSLAKVLRYQGHSDSADWCEQRAAAGP